MSTNPENVASTPLMTTKENQENVIVSPHGKTLIREDTILANIPGCALCGTVNFTCSAVKNQWSVLCWGRPSDKKYYFLLVLLASTLVLSLMGTIFFSLNNTINDAVLSNMVIRNNTLSYSLWRQPSVQPLMKVYLFNYTNWKDVKEGREKKLHVEEVGPYVYSQQIERVNVKFNDDKLSYQEKNYFRYLPEQSVGANFDKVFVPNLPLLGLVAKTKSMELNTFQQLTLESLLVSFAKNHEAFIELPVHRFLWGYDDTIIDTVKIFMRWRGEMKFNKFGLLATKNDTLSERLTINTGEWSKDKMNVLEGVEGEDHLPYWDSPYCNSIEATDGTIFPPVMLDKKSTLHVFYPNLCRRLPYIFDKDVEVGDIPLLRYKMPTNVFDDPSGNPDNQCYCQLDTGICPPKGVIDVSACTMGAPALVSFPHFHLGDPLLRENVSGLRPDPALHESHFDIHQTLGLTLYGKSSLQINVEVKNTPPFTSVGFLQKGTILPVAWLEMSVTELPESIRTLIYHGTYSTAAIQLVIRVICILSLIISALCLFTLIFGRRPKPCVSIHHKPELEKTQVSCS
ncbi:lysosome membrane protein 2-like [Achroia grisella]|uniref:lysosome membrane protein 2-like n=1 Tax=Achroia grisella TaxID=688607 RepID=UPI0027D2EDE7|nr:lysosome membrane protein 2-like [Achroia grisella]